MNRTYKIGHVKIETGEYRGIVCDPTGKEFVLMDGPPYLTAKEAEEAADYKICLINKLRGNTLSPRIYPTVGSN